MTLDTASFLRVVQVLVRMQMLMRLLVQMQALMQMQIQMLVQVLKYPSASPQIDLFSRSST